MNTPSPLELTSFFNTLCDAAAKETLPRFRTKVTIDNKEVDGFDPVTEGDQEAEKAIRKLIQEHYPNHGIIGEEFGRHNEEADLQWVIDPIDGTRAFISGLPVWGTLMGLYQDGKPIAGVMDQPFTGERFMAVDGQANLSCRGGESERLSTSAVKSISNATLLTTSPHIMQTAANEAYFMVEQQSQLFRYGCDCYAYSMLAAGQVDLVIEAELFIYDIAALIPIIEAAGGVVTNWQGGSCANGGQVLAAANAELHEAAMKVLNG
ncbi:MAG: histidinol-phosphatase [Rhizobiaceae bacterium]